MPFVALAGRLSLKNWQELGVYIVLPVSKAQVSWPLASLELYLDAGGLFWIGREVCRDGMVPLADYFELFGCLEQLFQMEMVVSSTSQMKN